MQTKQRLNSEFRQNCEENFTFWAFHPVLPHEGLLSKLISVLSTPLFFPALFFVFSCTDLFFMPSFLFFGYFSASAPSHLLSCFQTLFLRLCKEKCRSFRFFLRDDCYCGPLHILLQIPKNKSLKPRILFHI